MSKIVGTISSIDNVSGNISSNFKISGKINSSDNISGNIVNTILRGLSAYEIAVKNGYSGTEQQWVDSLNGLDGYSPYIGQNGHWFVYDDNTQEYIDTGKSAIINVGNGLVKDPITDAISVDFSEVNERIDYEKANNLPKIESMELIGNKSLSDFGVSSIDIDDLLEILQ